MVIFYPLLSQELNQTAKEEGVLYELRTKDLDATDGSLRKKYLNIKTVLEP